jgi:AraC-like DNA-binding protein
VRATQGAKEGPRIRSQLVGAVLAHLTARGADAALLARDFALSPTAASDPEVVLPLERLRAFFDAAADAVRDPHLGLSVARTAEGRWPIYEYGGRSAPTLRDALERMARYVAIFNDRVVVAFAEAKGEGTISHHLPGHPLCLGRHGNEFFAASTLHRARLAAGRELEPTHVFFAHPPPSDLAPLRSFFGPGARLSFEAERNGVTLSRDDLDRPLPSHDPALLGLVDSHAARSLADHRPEPTALADRARARIRERLRELEPTIDDVAADLGMSGRTLQRRLADEGLTHQGLLQAVREELAKAYLADPARPVAEVAFLLGYAELAPFHRAFRRWTGTTPAAYRRAESERAGASSRPSPPPVRGDRRR